MGRERARASSDSAERDPATLNADYNPQVVFDDDNLVKSSGLFKYWDII